MVASQDVGGGGQGSYWFIRVVFLTAVIPLILMRERDAFYSLTSGHVLISCFCLFSQQKTNKQNKEEANNCCSLDWTCLGMGANFS